MKVIAPDWNARSASGNRRGLWPSQPISMPALRKTEMVIRLPCLEGCQVSVSPDGRASGLALSATFCVEGCHRASGSAAGPVTTGAEDLTPVIRLAVLDQRERGIPNHCVMLIVLVPLELVGGVLADLGRRQNDLLPPASASTWAAHARSNI